MEMAHEVVSLEYSGMYYSGMWCSSVGSAWGRITLSSILHTCGVPHKHTLAMY